MSERNDGGRALLISAFDRFQGAANTLEHQHETLRAEVDRLERSLLVANQRLEAVLDALTTGVAVVSPEGETLRANKAFERMGFDTVHADPELRRLTENGGSRMKTARLTRATADGELDLVVTRVPVGDDSGTQVVTVLDVTEIRRQEQEGGRRRRLEALGRMAAELAHEVRNPLGSIRLFASMLHDDLQDRPQQADMTKQILIAGSSLEAIVSNLLNFAAPNQASKREIDLTAVATDACALLAPTSALRGVRIVAPAVEPCPVVADPEALRQVVLNLLGNALAATATDGSIEVRTLRDRDRAVLLVQDDGCGIEPEILPRVFDPFFTGREDGTGLGLSVVHRIVERHDGHISLDSRPGKGTRVRVEIPHKAFERERT